MKHLQIFALLAFALTGCENQLETRAPNQEEELLEINTIMDQWHEDAASANGKAYFNAMAEGSVFIGTDATENWEKSDFQEWSNPFFERGSAWSFKALERNVYFNSKLDIAWFDELLSTQMKICRGSGVLEKVEDVWKIKQYVLSMTIPNDLVDTIVSLKSPIENILLLELE